MTMTIFAKVEDEGQMGAKLTVYGDSSPRTCPGLGGWKNGGGITWWTRVKGEVAAMLCAALVGPQNAYMALRIADSGQVEAVAQLDGADIMDDDLAAANADGSLHWRQI